MKTLLQSAKGKKGFSLLSDESKKTLGTTALQSPFTSTDISARYLQLYLKEYKNPTLVYSCAQHPAPGYPTTLIASSSKAG